MKKILLTIILCFSCVLNVYASQMTVTNGTLSVTGVMDEDGGYTFAYAGQYEYGIVNVGENIFVDTYKTDGTFKETYKINIVDEKFGGYVYDGTYHYFLFGNDNLNCSGSTTIYKVIKYSQTFSKISTLTLKGSQVYARRIFLSENGLCDFRVDGEYLFINDVIEEYRYENKYYQNNRSYVINKNTLRCENSVGGISLSKTKTGRDEVSANMSASYDNKFYFAVNMTSGIELFELDPTDNESTGNHTVKNLANSALTSYRGDTTEALTDYGEISNVQTVKISSDDIMVMWQDGERISYCHLDGEGKLNGTIKRIYGAEFGRTAPYYNSYDSSIVWAYMVNDDDYAFYKFGPRDYE